MSNVPYFSTANSTRAFTSSCFATFTQNEAASPPACSISFTALSEGAISATTTFAPSSASFNAIPFPSPLPAPVTIATLFSNLFIFIFLSFYIFINNFLIQKLLLY